MTKSSKSKKTAKKATPASKAKKAPAKKKAPKKAVKKAPAKPVKKKVPAKKKVAKKTPAKKKAAKKAAAKKPAAKKTTSKKTASKKTAVKKPVAKKAPSKKAAAKKTVAKKSAKKSTKKAATAKGKKLPPTPVEEVATPERLAQLKIEREERNEKLKELVAQARDQGYLTYEDINQTLPDSMVSADEFEGILILLKGMDIQVIESDDVEKFKVQQEKDERAKASDRMDVLDDPVRMYLKQMGQVPLLTREQEVEISMRIEEAEIHAKAIFNNFGCATNAYLGLADRLEAGKERFDRIINDKHVESRDKYLRALPRLRNNIDRNYEAVQTKFAGTQKSRLAKTARARKVKDFEKNRSRLAGYFEKLYYKQKAVEDIMEVTDTHYRELRALLATQRKLEAARKSKSQQDGLKEAAANIKAFELLHCMEAE